MLLCWKSGTLDISSDGIIAGCRIWFESSALSGEAERYVEQFRLFPLDSIRFFGGVLRSGVHAAVRGE